MDISFSTPKLRELCEVRRVAERKLGTDCAKKLRTRLDDLDAAGNVLELPAGRPHPLKGDRKGQFSVDLAGGWRLVFEPAHDPCPTSNDGAIDWARVTHIRIVFIGDYHD